MHHPRRFFTNIGIWVGLITSYLNILLNVCDDLVTKLPNVINTIDFDFETLANIITGWHCDTIVTMFVAKSNTL